jgi:hypothetical protein
MGLTINSHEQYTYTEILNLHLKQGWNLVYGKGTYDENGNRTHTSTTTKPDGNFKWYYNSYNAYDDDPVVEPEPDNGAVTDLTITGTVENGSDFPEIASVKFVVGINDIGVIEEDVLANGTYQNGQFTITLPESMDNSYLWPLFEDGIPSGVTVSNGNVKGGVAELEAYNEVGDRIGYLYFRIDDRTEREGYYMYVDGDVIAKGSYIADQYGQTTVTEILNVSLKQGWNIVYGKETADGNDNFVYESTTTKPDGNLKWYYTAYPWAIDPLEIVSEGTVGKAPLL